MKKPDAGNNRKRALFLLDQLKDLLQEEYYDKAYRGVDMEAKFKFAKQEIGKQEYSSDMYRTLAASLAELRDTHTVFYPPDRQFRAEYGFSAMIIGNGCFVTSVKRGSDAETQGVHEGDEILSMAGFPVTRDTFPQIQYLIYGLELKETLRLQLKLTDNSVHDFEIKTRFLSPKERKEEQKRLKKEEESKPFSCNEINPDLEACKLRTFVADNEAIDQMMKSVKGHKSLILDLRGNSGGYTTTLDYVLGYFFQRKILIGRNIARGKAEEEWSKVRKDDIFSGELAVVVDSTSASASEVFARVIQLEKRGKVIGDTSAGAVMTSVVYGIPVPLNFANQMGNMTTYTNQYYISLVSVSVADFLMRDGGRLEGTGVVPDRRIGPNDIALRKKNDPVLSFVAEQYGGKMSPEAAALLHFLIPKSEDRADDQDDPKNGK